MIILLELEFYDAYAFAIVGMEPQVLSIGDNLILLNKRYMF
jgi:hypothetical protein